IGRDRHFRKRNDPRLKDSGGRKSFNFYDNLGGPLARLNLSVPAVLGSGTTFSAVKFTTRLL
ncbi:MAG: hypothetical protein RR213_06725, partial [Raoultibacter sp.]